MYNCTQFVGLAGKLGRKQEFPNAFLPELTRGARAVGVLRTAVAVAALAATALPQAHAVGVSGQGTWETTLQARDLDGDASTIEAYYDTDLDITWLADANYAKTSGYTSAANGGVAPDTVYDNYAKWTNGAMAWYGALSWSTQLDINGIGGWRLSTASDLGNPGCDYAYGGTDCGFNVDTSASELAHLYYVTLGNKAYFTDSSGVSQSGWSLLANTGPFSNVQASTYWTNEEFWSLDVHIDGGQAWLFNFGYGNQVGAGFNYASHAWAVHSGDVGVAVPSVPEPETYTLALAGLAAAALLARKRRA